MDFSLKKGSLLCSFFILSISIYLSFLLVVVGGGVEEQWVLIMKDE